MNSETLQNRISAARAKYTPGVPMNAETDQDVLRGIIDGLGGASAKGGSEAWSKGVGIGRYLRRVLK